MATTAAPLASQLNIESDPWIGSMAFLIPLSLYICADDSIGMGAVLLTRLMVIVSMNFVQKESVASFPVWFLLGYQMALQVVLIGVYNFRNLKVGKWIDLGRWLGWMTPFWIAQLVTSLYAFKAASVSAIQIIRSILPLFSFAMEKILYNDPEHVSMLLVLSMVLVVIGTMLYGCSSASVTVEALMWIFVNSVFTVVATVFRSKFMKDENFSVSTPLCMCSVSTTAIPFICVAAALTGEMDQWPAVVANASSTAWLWATMSSLIAGCFSFLQFRCQKKLSGTSDLMFQNAVKVFIIIMGMLAFGDAFNMESLLACALALGGCAWYGFLRKSEVAGSAKAHGSFVKEPKSMFTTTPPVEHTLLEQPLLAQPVKASTKPCGASLSLGVGAALLSVLALAVLVSSRGPSPLDAGPHGVSRSFLWSSTQLRSKGQHMSMIVMGRKNLIYKPGPLPGSSGTSAILNRSLPGVFVLHGSAEEPADMYARGFDEALATSLQVMIVYPEMQVPASDDWGYVSDIPFFRALGDRLRENDIGLDGSRAFVCGFSAGGAMALFLQNEVQTFQAAASVEAGPGYLKTWHKSNPGHRTMLVWNHADPELTGCFNMMPSWPACRGEVPEMSEVANWDTMIATLRRHGSLQPSVTKRLPLSGQSASSELKYGKTLFAELIDFQQDTAPELRIVSWRSDPGIHEWPSLSNNGFDATELVMNFFLKEA